MKFMIATALLAGGVPLVAAAWQTSPPSKSNYAVVEVKCNSQGQTDMRQTITTTVDDNNPDTPPVTVTADLPEHVTSKDIAARLVFLMRERGIICYLTEPTDSGFDPRQCEQINLPAGFGFTAPAVVGKKRSTSWDGKQDHVNFHIGGKPANGGNPGPLPAELTFHAFDVSLDSFSGTPLRLELRVNGVNLDDMSSVNAVHTVTYPTASVLPINRLKSIGQYLKGLGMSVSYPTNSKLHVEVDPSNIQVNYVSFMATILTVDEDKEYDLSYSFRAN
jgi:hypothetical protein